MLPDDTEASAKNSASMFNDPRVHNFYDSDKHSGKAIANCLGWTGKVAWDIYMFYEAGVEWVKNPPKPACWMHQLTDSWADPEHYHTGADLVNELFMTMKKLSEIPHS
jgi:hypothetical protein